KKAMERARERCGYPVVFDNVLAQRPPNRCIAGAQVPQSVSSPSRLQAKKFHVHPKRENVSGEQDTKVGRVSISEVRIVPFEKICGNKVVSSWTTDHQGNFVRIPTYPSYDPVTISLKRQNPYWEFNRTTYFAT
ncbi:hypothetical protein PV326_009216, partial [Microctonus aethiopoides]